MMLRALRAVEVDEHSDRTTEVKCRQNPATMKAINVYALRKLTCPILSLSASLLSGVGEASFVTVVPPLITETAPPGERGIWLALFYTAQPVGAGIGYVYGSLMATSRLG